MTVIHSHSVVVYSLPLVYHNNTSILPHYVIILYTIIELILSYIILFHCHCTIYMYNIHDINNIAKQCVV